MMKNTKKSKKMNKTTKRYKGGIRKNNVSTFITQTAGYNSIFVDGQSGGVAPSPGPAGLNIYNLELSSLRNSLQSYGDAIYSIVDTAQTGLDIYNLPTGAPTAVNNATPSYNEMVIQYNSAKRLYDASIILKNKFTELYQLIYGSTAVFMYTPSPVAAQSGGQNAAPPVVSGITQTALQSTLQQFGDAVNVLNSITETNNSLFNTTAPLTEVASSDTMPYTAYSAFVSQKIAAESLNEAINSTYESFVGTSDYNPASSTGSRGLYRSLLGDSFSFTPSALPPGTVARQSNSRQTSSPTPRPAAI